MVKQETYIPERGHLIWLTFNPQAGHEQAGRHPAVVLSPAAYNRKAGLVLLCPVTQQLKGYPFEVGLPLDIQVKGVILADQVKSLDWRVRKAELICSLPLETMNEVLDKIRLLL